MPGQNLYITAEELTNAGIAPDSDNSDIWELLAEGVSRLFDRECEVADGFFNKAGTSTSVKSYRSNGTGFIRLFPYIADSITAVSIDSVDSFNATPAERVYREADGYLVFDSNISDRAIVLVTARYGFPAIPANVKLACIEQGLHLWRKKDLSFAEISGVSAGALNAEFSPTFLAVTRRYRDQYSNNNSFS